MTKQLAVILAVSIIKKIGYVINDINIHTNLKTFFG